ncbi:hypothetical protein D3C73_699750 [compost metagenome]
MSKRKIPLHIQVETFVFEIVLKCATQLRHRVPLQDTILVINLKISVLIFPNWVPSRKIYAVKLYFLTILNRDTCFGIVGSLVFIQPKLINGRTYF